MTFSIFQIFYHFYSLQQEYSCPHVCAIVYKVTSLGRSLSAVQLPFDIKILCSFGYIRKLVFASSWGNSHFSLQPTYGDQAYQTCTDTALSGYQIHTLVEWSLVDLFLVPREIHQLGQCRVQTRDLLIHCRTHYHWINSPQFSLSVLCLANWRTIHLNY